VVGGGVRSGIARSEQPGQRFAAGDLGAVQKHQQRVMTPGLLPGRGRVLLVVGMVDGDGGIDIQMQPLARIRRGPGRPCRGPRVSPGRPDSG
jgi:hypothetical protein